MITQKSVIQDSQKNQLMVRSSVSFNLQTYRENDDSVEFVLATEEPADVWDWGTCDIVKETLVASGVKFPKNRQIPLLDSHNRDGIKNILGSVRDFRIEKDQVVGRLYFSKKKEAQEALQMIREGHLDSGSVGYIQTDSVWIEDGNTLIHEGRSYKGPLLLTRSWNLNEYSLVAIGADPNAKAREAVINNVTDSQLAVNESNSETKGENVMENETKTIEQPAVNVAEVERKAVENERARVAHIRAVCEKHNCRDMIDTLISGGYSAEAANSAVLDELAKRSVPVAAAKSTITMVADAKDKFRAAAIDGILLRAGNTVENPAAGSEELRGYSIRELSREVLRQNGHNGMLSDEQALKLVFRAGSQAYDDFSHILDQSMNKAVMNGYKQASDTWKMFCTKGSLTNLEPAKRVDINDLPDFEQNPEGAELHNSILGDKGEQVQLISYGNTVSLTRRAILADDLGLFGRIARKIGYRAAMKAEALAYGVLTGNANMSDGVALFHASHNNLAGSGGALSKATLAAAFAAIQKQTDANGSKLAITPKFVLVGPDEAVEAEILTASTIDPSSTNTMGQTNFFKNKGLVAISSPFIDTTNNGFFLIADPSSCDTIEIDFLNGKETPTIEVIDNDGDILSRKWRYYFDIGAKALDFRGMYKTAHS